MKSCLPAHNSQVRSRTYITKQELSTSAEAYGTNTTQHRKVNSEPFIISFS